MGATYTRQSSYSDGDTITAAHTNDEFNQLLAAFASSTGHTHDGTTAEGGPITKLLGTAITIGDGTAGTDIAVTFDGESNDGVLTWKEDEDYFEFSDDILVASTGKLQFRDTAIYINSSTDGQLDLVADTEIQLAATTIDINGNADVSGTLTYGSLSDGSITITAFVDEDNMASNSATLVPTQQSVKAYVDTQLTAEDLDFQADSGGALSIDLDSETLTFTGGTGIDTSGSGNAVTFAIDSTVTTLSGTQTLTNKTLTSPKINEDVVLTSTATELNLLDGVSGLVQADFTKLAAVNATATELNIMDGDSSIGTTAVSDGHGIVMNHGGTMAQTTVQTLAAYLDDEITAMPNLVTTAATTVGALNSGSITSGFGNIDVGSSNLTATGTISLGATSFNDNAITNVGDIALDSISADGTDINVAVSDNSATAFTIKQGSDNYLVIDTANSSESVAIGTGISGTAISIGHGTSETTINDNLTVTGDLTVNGATTTVDTTNTTVKDNLLELNSGASSNSNDSGIIIQRGSTGNDALFMWDESEDKFALGTTTDNASSTGNLNMTTGTLVANIEGNVTGNVTGNVSGTAATVTGAAQSNITSLGTLTTLTVDNIIVNGTTIGHTDDTDLITLADGIATVAGEISVTTLDIGGTNVSSTAAELNLVDGSSAGTIVNSKAVIYGSSGEVNATTLQIGGTSITATAAELNYVDGVTSAIQTQLNTKATKGFATAMAIAL